jgi:hypothetical protein
MSRVVDGYWYLVQFEFDPAQIIGGMSRVVDGYWYLVQFEFELVFMF